MKMPLKTVFLCTSCLYIFGVFGASPNSQSNIEGGLDVKDAIEKFLKDLQSKIPEVIIIGDQNLTIPNNKYIKGTLNFTNISITGLKEFNATVIYRNFVPIPKAYTLTLENICLNLDYKSDLILYNSKYLSVFGQGAASIRLNNFVSDGNISVSLLPINASTTAEIDLNSILVNINGLLNDEILSNEFGKVLGETSTTVFKTNKSSLSEILTKTINTMIQAILSHRQFIEKESFDLTKAVSYIFQELFNTTTYID